MATMGYFTGFYDKPIEDQVLTLRKAGRAAMIALEQCGVAGGVVTVKGLKEVVGFNKAQMAPLLVDFYDVTEKATELLVILHEEEKKVKANCLALEKEVRIGPLTPDIVREIVKEEVSGAVQDLDSKLNHSKELTEKKWSDLFKSNKEDLKDQKKQATKQRLELEKTMANNKRQTVVDNLERQKRASNVCVSNVAESKKTDKKEKYEEECDTVINILQLNADDVKHVFRAGPLRDKPRPIICVLSSPELANTQHSYGKGRAIRDNEGKNILYWVNPDFIKTDRVANFKARHAKPKNSDTDQA